MRALRILIGISLSLAACGDGGPNVGRHPSTQDYQAMAYDAGSDRVILFGGFGGSETWEYDFNTNVWTNMNPVEHPSGRWGHAMAYDEGSDRVVLFGGEMAGVIPSSETWAYDFNTDTWTDMNPAPRPLGRAFHAMAYDAESDRVILFGGGPPRNPINYGDTWAYDFNTNSWADMNPATSPDPRANHAIAYDAQSDRVISFGGSFQGIGDVGDTWAYDFNSNTWTDMSPTPSPTVRGGHQMVYDARSDRIILFAGVTGELGNLFYYDETWAYDFDTNAWTQLRPSMKPSERICVALAYDAESGRVILFGSEDSDDTWAYDFNTNTWTHMQ